MNMDSYCLTSDLSLFGRQLACNIRRTTLWGCRPFRTDQASPLVRLFAAIGICGTLAAAALITLAMFHQ